MKKTTIGLSILITFVLWYVMFVLRPFNFWIMMSISTTLLSLFALYFGRPFALNKEWNWQNILIGIAAAFVLYGIFWLGHYTLLLLEHLEPTVISDRAANLKSIYANRGELAPHWITILLIFPIGFGEEFYWRGFIQKSLSNRRNRWIGFIITTVLYTAVHISTGNKVLILAALICGIYWGSLYMATGRLLPVIISHMIWDPFIFVIYPIV